MDLFSTPFARGFGALGDLMRVMGRYPFAGEGRGALRQEALDILGGLRSDPMAMVGFGSAIGGALLAGPAIYSGIANLRRGRYGRGLAYLIGGAALAGGLAYGGLNVPGQIHSFRDDFQWSDMPGVSWRKPNRDRPAPPPLVTPPPADPSPAAPPIVTPPPAEPLTDTAAVGDTPGVNLSRPARASWIPNTWNRLRDTMSYFMVNEANKVGAQYGDQLILNFHENMFAGASARVGGMVSALRGVFSGYRNRFHDYVRRGILPEGQMRLPL
ncbi:MAG: hypothetical protein KatS3mg023_3696 [Armatimonadota bacterium]|nr:MAG: hypothetical protein KatS3mg023_3696 [Armatimonadota bacterium]